METKKAAALLIDNGKADVRPVRRMLERAGLECVTSDREEALFHIYASHPDLVVLTSPGDESLPILMAIQVISDTPTIALFPHLSTASVEKARQMEVGTWLDIGDEAGLVDRIAKLLT